MKIAILGSNSFLAHSCLSDWSGSGHELTLFSRLAPVSCPAGANWQRFELPDVAVAAEQLAAYEVVIYAVAAGVQSGDPTSVDALYFANALHPLRLLAELARVGFAGKWISFGSYFEIGDVPRSGAFDEVALLAARFPVPNAYCDSKRLLTRGIAFGRWPFRVYHFVLPTIYGWREDPARVIPYVINCLNNGKVPALSAGVQSRQYMHVADVARLVQQAFTVSLPTGIYNAAPVGTLSIREVVMTVYHCLRCKDEPHFGVVQTRDETMRHLELDGRALALATGWRPVVTLEEGIAEYLTKIK